MPVSIVIIGGIARPGLTSVCRVPRHSPARTLTMPISVIRSVMRSPPVVSMSSTQKVTSASGVPRSSNDRCPPAAVRITTVHHERAFEVKNKCSIRRRHGGRYSGAGECRPRSRRAGHVLRPALEFAVGIAAAGAKLRPPVVVSVRVAADSCGSTSCRPPRWHRSAPPSRPTRTSAAVWLPSRPPRLSTRSECCGCRGPEGWVQADRRAAAREAALTTTAGVRREERRRKAAESKLARAAAELSRAERRPRTRARRKGGC